MTRLLITGATGFIGEPAVRAAREYFEVHATARNCREQVPSGVQFRTCDLLNPADTIRLIEEVRPTHLLHLAWIATPGIYWTSPDNHRWVEASKQLLLTFARCGGKRAVLTGSCAEYDWTVGGVCHETNTPARPHTTYGRCKLALAQWAEMFSREREIDIAWARLFWMYGPRESPVRLVPSVARSLLAGVSAACTSGTQIRDFLHVSDVASALVSLLQSRLTGPVNIGSGRPIAVRELIECVARSCGRPDLIRLGERDTPTSEPPILVADVQRLHEELGWRPRIDLITGLCETVGWWRGTTSEGVRKCA